MSKKITVLFVLLWIGFQAFAQSVQALKLADAALALTKQKVVYDPAYFKILILTAMRPKAKAFAQM
ncbi:hypothetical protein [Pedobacter sp. UC225_65]|uniref:hypothetical protein n=1 Tax=Pedobacter sp. UC225_65 TaxID=3350173 RepID=UPI00366A8A9A